MNPRSLCAPLRAAAVLSFSLLAAHAAFPQAAAISLDPTTVRPPAVAPVKGEASYANPPANFYAFASARVGEPATVEGLKLHFAAPTTLGAITSTKDFTVEQGGSCAAGKSFAKGDTCILLVRFTPQGPGPRLGHITVSHSASATPFSLGLGGNGYAPVLSFTPSVIKTVTGTYPGGSGLLKNAQNLTVDGSDDLYIADTGNGIIRYMDSSGNISTLASSYTDPVGVAVDTFGDVYFDQNSANAVDEIYNYGPVFTVSGTGTDPCTVSTPACYLSGEAVKSPGQMSIDRNNNLFFVDETGGVTLSTVLPEPQTFLNLNDPFPYQENFIDAFAVDSSDNLYTLWAPTGYPNCEIQQQSLYNAENSITNFRKVVGGRVCGFSGDGGQAGNAEIGSVVGQIAFDLVGNLYFSDTNNQRVRRVDNVTGIISTIAGNGTAGYSGDGGQSTAAEIKSPAGVTVDSQGQVYIISSTNPGTSQVVRKVGPNGFLGFGSQNVGTTSAAHIVTVANTGNDDLELTKELITGTNASDFSIDSTTTSCILTAGSYLYEGQSCQIGVLFKPAAAGARSASIKLLDNTVTNSNLILLGGTGVTPPSVKTSPSTIAFPATAPDHSSAKTITVTNTGESDLTIAGITAGGANPKTFGYTSSCGAGPIAPKATCTLQVVFKPASTGSYSANFKITDNAPDSPQTISVAGTASVVSLPPVVTQHPLATSR